MTHGPRVWDVDPQVVANSAPHAPSAHLALMGGARYTDATSSHLPPTSLAHAAVDEIPLLVPRCSPFVDPVIFDPYAFCETTKKPSQALIIWEVVKLQSACVSVKDIKFWW